MLLSAGKPLKTAKRHLGHLHRAEAAVLMGLEKPSSGRECTKVTKVPVITISEFRQCVQPSPGKSDQSDLIRVNPSKSDHKLLMAKEIKPDQSGSK